MDDTELEHRAEEENYFVSMTDMMTGLVFIFIVMLMYFAVQLSQTSQTKEVEQKRLERINEALQGADKTREAILSQIRDRLRRAGIEVEIIPEQGILRLPNEILFDLGRSTVTEGGRAKLKTLAGILQDILPCYTERRDGSPPPDHCETQAGAGHRIESLYIEGHTDKQPYLGGTRDNWDLSAERAISTYRLLVSFNSLLNELCFRNAAKICDPILGVSGYGPDRPANSAETKDAFAQNRRIDLRVLMATPSLEEVQAEIDSRSPSDNGP